MLSEPVPTLLLPCPCSHIAPTTLHPFCPTPPSFHLMPTSAGIWQMLLYNPGVFQAAAPACALRSGASVCSCVVWCHPRCCTLLAPCHPATLAQIPAQPFASWRHQCCAVWLHLALPTALRGRQPGGSCWVFAPSPSCGHPGRAVPRLCAGASSSSQARSGWVTHSFAPSFGVTAAVTHFPHPLKRAPDGEAAAASAPAAQEMLTVIFHSIFGTKCAVGDGGREGSSPRSCLRGLAELSSAPKAHF